MIDGRIVKGIGGFYYVKTVHGDVVECKARGKFRKDKITPMIGDFVKIFDGSIVDILKRKTSLIRPAVANIDRIVIVAAAAAPEPNLYLLDKMLVIAEFHQIEPLICINKTDIANDNDLRLIYEKAGYTIISTSAQDGDGVDKLKPYLNNHVTAFAGLSGVGKSTILTRLTGMGLETGDVSSKIQRGKHTTRHVELIEFGDNGFVLDTPGFSSLEIDDMPFQDLALYFPEMKPYHNDCRFRGCAHVNEPDCRVKKAIEDGEMLPSRYESYKEIHSVLKQRKDWEK